jgi:high-affinity iron transporter
MSWADALPNLLIGLREGLEAGLIVSILLAAVRKTGSGATSRASATPVWLGVLGAVTLAASLAAVLTFSDTALSSHAQEAVGGILSVLAVGLVTTMIFWMRRAAAGLSAHLRGEVERAVTVGAGALAITAYLAVGREGLETTLFLWAAARASGSTAAPLLGAAVGLGIAVFLCWLLYRRAIRLDVGAFFRRTAFGLIVIAAGVLAYGLGDLQDAGLLPGQRWIAFDFSAHADPGSWWVSVISGITDLTSKMTVLQVVAWLAYLAVVVPAFVRSGRDLAAPARSADAGIAAGAAEPATAPAGAAERPPGGGAGARPASRPAGWEALVARRPWPVATGLVLVPALAATVAIAVLPAASAGASTVTVSRTGCARDWTAATAGQQTIRVANNSGAAGEINLDNAGGAVVAEIETIGPATTAAMTARLGPGTYTIRCLMSGRPPASSAPVQVTGRAAGPVTLAIRPVTLTELTGPNRQYQAYAAGVLARLAGTAGSIEAGLTRGDLAAARRSWVSAQLDWERVGASYDSFGELGVAVDGLPDGLPEGVHDPHFTGLKRLEYGLWHGQNAAVLLPVARTLASNIAAVRRHLSSDDLAGDPANLPIRAHEILEDALRDHLSGLDDEGAGAAYAQTYADVQVTRVVLGELGPIITARAPALLPAIDAELITLDQALLAARAHGRWRAPPATPLPARERADGAIGAALQSLSSVPDLLEVPPSQ